MIEIRERDNGRDMEMIERKMAMIEKIRMIEINYLFFCSSEFLHPKFTILEYLFNIRTFDYL